MEVPRQRARRREGEIRPSGGRNPQDLDARRYSKQESAVDDGRALRLAHGDLAHRAHSERSDRIDLLSLDIAKERKQGPCACSRKCAPRAASPLRPTRPWPHEKRPAALGGSGPLSRRGKPWRRLSDGRPGLGRNDQQDDDRYQREEDRQDDPEERTATLARGEQEREVDEEHPQEDGDDPPDPHPEPGRRYESGAYAPPNDEPL